MPGIVINGAHVLVPGVKIRNFLDDPALRLSAGDRRARATRWVRALFFHTTVGDPVKIQPGIGPDLHGDENLVKFYNEQVGHNGVHAGMDTDASMAWYADALTEVCYHATTVNEVSIGIELKQTADGKLWQCQPDAGVLVAKTLCAAFGIQFQVQCPYMGDSHPVPRLAAGAKDCVGIFGHRDQTDRRGVGDPGDEVYQAAMASGAEPLNFAVDQDKHVWAPRQEALNKALKLSPPLTCDGVPGPATVAALKQAGYKDGIFAFGKI